MGQAAGRRTILMASPYFPPALGGLEQYAARLADQLARRHNWRVIVVTSGDRNGADRCEVVNGHTVYRLSYGLKISNTPVGVRWLGRLRSIIEQERPDLIDVHLPVPGIADLTAFAAKGVPLVVTYHATSMRKGQLRYDVPVRAYERVIGHALLMKASRIICTSTAARDFLQPYLGKSVVVPPGVDTRVFAPGGGPRGQRLLFVGNLARSYSHKGLSHLVEALSHPSCRQVCLDIVGDGRGRADYEAQCARLGLADRVTFHGRLYGHSLAARYAQSYALVQPSTRDSLPTTIIEAMACGLPVIASRVGATSQLVQPGISGCLVDPGDVPSLAGAISGLFADPGKAAAYGRAGRQHVEGLYTAEEQADRTAAVFDELMKGSHQKVAVVTPYYFPRVGGLENYARRNVQTLRKAGFPVVVITSAHAGKRRVRDEVDGVTVYRLPRLIRLLNTPLHPLWPLWLRVLFAREGVTAVNVHTPVPVMADAARLARGRRQFIVTYHNDLVKGGRLGRLLCQLEYRLLTGPTLAAADNVIVTSEYYAHSSARLRGARDKVAISSPGVDLSLFCRADGPGADRRGAVPGRFIFVGQLDRTHRHKGLDRLLQAMPLVRREVPGASLIVVGQGNDRERYVAAASALGLGAAAEFVGFVPDEELRALYASAWAVVLPTEHDAEGFGMVVLEAAACGTPAIGTSVGGIPAAIVDEVTGVMVPPKDTARLAGALVRMARSPELRDRLAEHAYRRVSTNFSWDIQGAALVRVFRP